MFSRPKLTKSQALMWLNNIHLYKDLISIVTKVDPKISKEILMALKPKVSES